MDEEFFFPQNVRTSYRLWILGPRHLRRLAVAPVLAMLAFLPLYPISVFLAAVVAGLLGSAYAVAFCLPLLSDEQTLSDVHMEIRRNRRRQTYFAARKGVDGHSRMESDLEA